MQARNFLFQRKTFEPRSASKALLGGGCFLWVKGLLRSYFFLLNINHLQRAADFQLMETSKEILEPVKSSEHKCGPKKQTYECHFKEKNLELVSAARKFYVNQR
jgi:hypothetical protein